jgi:hypothetical protein
MANGWPAGSVTGGGFDTILMPVLAESEGAIPHPIPTAPTNKEMLFDHFDRQNEYDTLFFIPIHGHNPVRVA